MSRADMGRQTDAVPELHAALTRYFDLMYDCDLSRFDTIFAPTVQLHGYREGRLLCWSAEAYKAILRERVSPKTQGAKRGDEIIALDVAGPEQAFTKVRVKIARLVFVDYLTWHRIEGAWRITSKGFHLEREDAEL